VAQLFLTPPEKKGRKKRKSGRGVCLKNPTKWRNTHKGKKAQEENGRRRLRTRISTEGGGNKKKTKAAHHIIRWKTALAWEKNIGVGRRRVPGDDGASYQGSDYVQWEKVRKSTGTT